LSRNKDRLGSTGAQATHAPPPQAMQDGGGGFSFVVPTEFVELPSKGRYYPENHPLHNEDTIEIKQMTAKEEDMLTSRALLKKGIAIDRVMKSLIINKAIDPQSLLVGDRNAIMVALRISGYGNEYTTNVTCPACSATQKYSFDLNDVLVEEGKVLEELSVSELGDGFFKTLLPKTECEVVFRLLTGAQEKTLVTQLENARKRNKEENTITTQLKLLTVSVNGDDSRATLDYFANNVPSLDAAHLRAAFSTASPNIDLTQHFACEECGHSQDMEVPLNADFFWPNR
jgi:hypothetical protein